jgi:glycosyltransferase involved in cell wall biosynthesis
VREGALLRLARARGLGTVAHLHGSRFVDYAREQPDRVRRVLRSATKVIVLSEATRDAVCQLIPEGRVELLPNAVLPGEPTAKERLAVFGGAVTRRKGVDLLIPAWRAAAAGTGWRLVIVGPHVEGGLIKDLPPDSEAVGPLAHEDLMRLLDRASIAVLPSRDEAMPMFILEAMARSACVVATEVGGIPSVIGEGEGVLVQPGNLAQLQDALSRVIRDGESRERMAAAGHRVFEKKFSARAVYPKIEALWIQAMADPRPA